MSGASGLPGDIGGDSPPLSSPTPSTSIPNVRPPSPEEENCAICLCKVGNRCRPNTCLHTFCFDCLRQWSKVKPECPLCKIRFRTIIYNIREDSTHDEFEVPIRTPRLSISLIGATELNDLYFRRPGSYYPHSSNFSNPASIYHFFVDSDRSDINAFMSSSSRTEPSPFPVYIQPSSDRPATSAQMLGARESVGHQNRRRIYDRDQWVRPVECVNHPSRYLNRSSEYIRSDPELNLRIRPWLQRELWVLLGLTHSEEQIAYIFNTVVRLIRAHDIRSREFREMISVYFGPQVNHFQHELHHYVISHMGMEDYDTHVTYPPPAFRNVQSTQVAPVVDIDSEESEAEWGVLNDSFEMLEGENDDGVADLSGREEVDEDTNDEADDGNEEEINEEDEFGAEDGDIIEAETETDEVGLEDIRVYVQNAGEFTASAPSWSDAYFEPETLSLGEAAWTEHSYATVPCMVENYVRVREPEITLPGLPSLRLNTTYLNPSVQSTPTPSVNGPWSVSSQPPHWRPLLNPALPAYTRNVFHNPLSLNPMCPNYSGHMGVPMTRTAPLVNFPPNAPSTNPVNRSSGEGFPVRSARSLAYERQLHQRQYQEFQYMQQRAVELQARRFLPHRELGNITMRELQNRYCPIPNEMPVYHQPSCAATEPSAATNTTPEDDRSYSTSATYRGSGFGVHIQIFPERRPEAGNASATGASTVNTYNSGFGITMESLPSENDLFSSNSESDDEDCILIDERPVQKRPPLDTITLSSDDEDEDVNNHISADRMGLIRPKRETVAPHSIENITRIEGAAASTNLTNGTNHFSMESNTTSQTVFSFPQSADHVVNLSTISSSDRYQSGANSGLRTCNDNNYKSAFAPTSVFLPNSYHRRKVTPLVNRLDSSSAQEHDIRFTHIPSRNSVTSNSFSNFDNSSPAANNDCINGCGAKRLKLSSDALALNCTERILGIPNSFRMNQSSSREIAPTRSAFDATLLNLKTEMDRQNRAAELYRSSLTATATGSSANLLDSVAKMENTGGNEVLRDLPYISNLLPTSNSEATNHDHSSTGVRDDCPNKRDGNSNSQGRDEIAANLLAIYRRQVSRNMRDQRPTNNRSSVIRHTRDNTIRRTELEALERFSSVERMYNGERNQRAMPAADGGVTGNVNHTSVVPEVSRPVLRVSNYLLSGLQYTSGPSNPNWWSESNKDSDRQ